MNVTVPGGADSCSHAAWPMTARQSIVLRPGWLTAMVTEVQEQLHREIAPVEPREPCHRLLVHNQVRYLDSTGV